MSEHIQRNHVNQEHKHEHLPGPSEGYQGLDFVLETASPPLLSETPFIERTIIYYHRYQTWTEFFRTLTGPAIYFDTFRNTWYDQEGIFHKDTVTRRQLASAWLAGLNRCRFHENLLEYVESGSQDRQLLSSEMKEKLRSAERLWRIYFTEIDQAIRLLSEYESANTTPARWHPYHPNFNIEDPQESQMLNGRSKKEHLTALFIYIALRVLYLEEEGYDQNFSEMIDKLDCARHRVCKIKGLSTFDSDDESDPPAPSDRIERPDTDHTQTTSQSELSAIRKRIPR
ncbi:hypothetical protein I302_101205 [Kwoniella bestiolae CBS 10118]|uniref:Uncharacterized protein n=1 Tax=Kwoniella bestiolae CBS 10118 TaxID=1296100 RepID=A0A1B9G784_9TREE|nr:hypothetical protein I302_04578 [Kwoniella bestiolae CBS 10118]OCF26888.1 hypothetical protein I302_04578 [Kwoniella bestiolae CBS 10118]